MRQGTYRRACHQFGAAIVSAMLTVALVATLASAVLWQQWRAIEVETAERTRGQAAWILTGALDWARLILREDARKGGPDHLAEPWAVPLEQARLSSFLAVDRSDALQADAAFDAFLSGQITDLQSRLNLTNLVREGRVDALARQAFVRLFALLELPPSELDTLLAGLRQAHGRARAASAALEGPTAPSVDDAKDAANAPAVDDAALLPQELEQLAWLGLSARTIERMRPFVTLLPQRTPVNLNTASAEVIYASVQAYELADAHRLVSARALNHFSTLADAERVVGKEDAKLSDTLHSLNSSFFEVRGRLQIDQAIVQERSLVQRTGLEVKTLWRRRGVEPGARPYNDRSPRP